MWLCKRLYISTDRLAASIPLVPYRQVHVSIVKLNGLLKLWCCYCQKYKMVKKCSKLLVYFIMQYVHLVRRTLCQAGGMRERCHIKKARRINKNYIIKSKFEFKRVASERWWWERSVRIAWGIFHRIFKRRLCRDKLPFCAKNYHIITTFSLTASIVSLIIAWGFVWPLEWLVLYSNVNKLDSSCSKNRAFSYSAISCASCHCLLRRQ